MNIKKPLNSGLTGSINIDYKHPKKRFLLANNSFKTSFRAIENASISWVLLLLHNFVFYKLPTLRTTTEEKERKKKEVANRGNITKMFIAYVCHATMHTNCLISHILIPRFLWVFDL